jgi:subtilisin-like proprotein convertase family protein
MIRSAVTPAACSLAAALFVSGATGAAAPVRSWHTILDSSQAREFEVALDELHFPGAPAVRRWQKISPQPSVESILLEAERQRLATGDEVELVLYPRGAPHHEFSRRFLTRQVLVQLEAGTDAAALARSLGASLAGRPPEMPGMFLFEAPQAGGALALAGQLAARPGVFSAQAQLARLRQKKLVPNDTYYTQQWHLRNIGQNSGTPGMDAGLITVWNTYRGSNIVIGIVDDGLQYAHPDLTPNYQAALSYDFNGHDANPAPDPSNGDYHGTCVAGVAAAKGNNGLGVCGVAFEAKLAGLRLIALPETDADEAAAFLHSNAVIHIKNNSWGAPDGYGLLDGPGSLAKAALAAGTASGRGGKGVIYVFAGGNGLEYGENINFDGYANSMHVLAVGAVSDRGQQADYSEPGACLVVAAPSSSSGRQSITTTDLTGNDGYNSTGASGELSDRNYTQTFGGTSSASPLAAGVIALVLQANPNLGWRDVKEILMRSARRVQPTDSDWQTNYAGLAHNHKFGGGLINAEAAVRLATNWANLGPMTNVTLLQTNLNLSIPDNNAAGVTRTFVITNLDFRVEHVTLTMTAPHPYWGDLAVTLTSPGGIQSRLAETIASVDASYSYQAWTFTSVRHWGEKANGTWTAKVADLAAYDSGTLQALELTLYGTTPKATLAVAETKTNTMVTLHSIAPGWIYALETATNLAPAAWSQRTTLIIGTNSQAAFLETNSIPQRFYRARLL